MSDLSSLAEELAALEQEAPAPKQPKGKPPRAPKAPRQEQGPEKKKKNKAVLALILVIVLFVGVIGGLLYYFLVYSAKSPMEHERDALIGALEGKTPAEMQDVLDDVLKEGEVLVGIAGEPIFEYNGAKGRIGIENDARNTYSFQVTITEDSTGDVLYESGIIDPGYYVEFIELSKTLAAGDYPATATITTYSLEESPDPIATIYAELTIHVTDGQFYQ